jgi:hypothetical protein
MNEVERLISEAQGYVELELYEEAWEAIEAAPASLRMNLPVLRTRLICAMALQRIDLAEELARFLAHAGGPTSIFAAHILQELAAIHLIGGDEAHARKLLSLAIEAHPGQRLSIIDDPTLKDLF